tara:strand:+ start:357 stop:1349 length:993 start_codon:yes stop_codon:yes gene_type:complete
MLINKQIFLKETPQGKLSNSHFETISSDIASPDNGKALIETLYISIDAANRAWMQGRTYRDQILPGNLMAGFALGKIIETKSDNFKVGDIVEGDLGWQNYSLKSENEIDKAHIISSLSLHMSVLGITGRTAYFGMKLADLKKEDTVLISAAAGAVGNVAGQIAKIKGCRVIGITGSEEKAKWLTQDLGFDGVVNYKNGNLVKDLKELCPNKVDVYFDNVGGDIFETIMFGMNNHGRVICCGALSQYDQAPPKNGPRGIPGIIVTKRLSLRGFIVMDFDGQKEEANKQLLEWINNKELLVAEDIVEGLENAPSALIGLLNGKNKGKRIVKI